MYCLNKDEMKFFICSDCDSMKIGGLISTNNMIDDDVKHVTISTTHTLLWTMSHTLANS